MPPLPDVARWGLLFVTTCNQTRIYCADCGAEIVLVEDTGDTLGRLAGAVGVHIHEHHPEI